MNAAEKAEHAQYLTEAGWTCRSKKGSQAWIDPHNGDVWTLHAAVQAENGLRPYPAPTRHGRPS